MRARIAAALISVAACAGDGGPSAIVEITSDLEIPRETNTLVARVQDTGGAQLVERTYQLGEAPNDAWPQTLPIVAGARHDEQVRVAAELRISAAGMPSVVVGFGERAVTFPNEGTETVTLEVPRSCIDADDDGFGIGFGCKRPDCDDADPVVPAQGFCPGYNPPPDAGPRPDTGPEGDAGEIDGGAPDAGIQDAGMLCGGEACAPDERCLMDRCLKECMQNEDCGGFHLACLSEFGVCICRLPCFGDQQDCGPYRCVDGCCEIE